MEASGEEGGRGLKNRKLSGPYTCATSYLELHLLNEMRAFSKHKPLPTTQSIMICLLVIDTQFVTVRNTLSKLFQHINNKLECKVIRDERTSIRS